jgi:LytS/YehU family sensor histidine kinase
MSVTLVKAAAWYETTLAYSLFILAALGVLAAVVYVYLKRSALKRKLLLSEIASLRLQMNPHFIFNSLNSIQDYIVHNESALASSYLSKFARLMRDILNNSQLRTISIEAECTFLNTYLELENLRFDNKLQYKITLADGVTPLDQVPPMLLQPIVENAIKHGLMPKETGPYCLDIFIERIDGYLSVRVTDNGVGRKQSEIHRKTALPAHNSKGIQVIGDRLRILEQLSGEAYALEIIDLYTGETPAGTSVILQIPNRHL